MSRKQRLGFYHKTVRSNKRLITLFEENQKLRYAGNERDWKNKGFIQKLEQSERLARKEILSFLRKGEIRTSDDFYRAAWFFHHGNNLRSYALAVALAAVSNHLGELWGKNLYAVAIDRFLLSIKNSQYFGTQIVREKGKWVLAPYDKKTGDDERKAYFVDPLEKTVKAAEKMNTE